MAIEATEKTALLELTKTLASLNGVSGDEQDIRKAILDRIPSGQKAEVTVDNLGNVIVFKKGVTTPNKKIMLAAHMDEVGFIVTDITSDGYLNFTTVGGITPAVVFGRQVRFKNGAVGVIGDKPVHLLIGDEKEKQPKISDLVIDIGAVSQEEAEQHVKRGDNAYFVSEYFEFGDGFVKGKALDDRAGCAILLELLNKHLPYDCWFVFTTQEEIGLRGATAAVYNVKPDYAVVIETTTACDIPDVEGGKRMCLLGEGVTVSIMDGTTVYDKEMVNLALDTAKEKGISCQVKTAVAGGNDSGIIHKSVGGVRTLTLSTPCRYLHSPACVIKKDDLFATYDLAESVIEKIAEL